MKEKYYRIGEVSKFTGVSKDTLHFYNKIGLLVPDHIDEDNQYRYYSNCNLWQLDVITMCRKLSIPLEKIKQILSSHDNQKVAALLMEYRQEALDQAAYYERVAEDILWYSQENERIARKSSYSDIKRQYIREETVISGNIENMNVSYHARLQNAAKKVLLQTKTIQRKYGYIIDAVAMEKGSVLKHAEYMKIAGADFSHAERENLLKIPAGEYAVTVVHIQNEQADFKPLLKWLDSNGYAPVAVYAEELGLQLFEYISDYYCEIRVLLKEKT